MADWRKVAKAFALRDGHISEKEIQVMRETFFDDDHISSREVDFLYELKKEARSAVLELDKLIEECEKARK